MRQNGHDVLVAGGGPAGLAVAAEVARQGLSVLLVEREEEIGVPVHTSGGTAPATVARHGIPRELYHPITTLRFVGPASAAVFSYEQPVLVIIDVRGTYQFLASRAESLGAQVETGTVARKPILAADGTVEGLFVEHEGELAERPARVVVDATGYRAAISKLAGLHAGFDRFGVGAEVELIAPRCRQDEVVLIVGSRYAPAGYGWVFPWGQDRVRVGVGVHHGDVRSNPRDHLDLLLEEAGRLGVDLDGAKRVEDHFGLIPAHSLPPQFSGRGIMAVGDAACQATLVVGEGIRVSLDAGGEAGRVAAAAIHAGTYRDGGLVPYEEWFRRSYERSLKIGHIINRRLASFDDPEWDEKFELLQAVPRDALPRVLQSDFSMRTVALMLTGSPRLWRSMAKYAGRAVRQSLTRA
jgi:digeranylgeranylglycerophospholipid reductase